MGMNGPRVHWIQHVPFEGLGSIQEWLSARDARVSASRMFEPVRFPPAGDIDLLIIMGGPMSVNDEDAHPWLRDEKKFAADAMSAGAAVLGVCLGAQVIASVLGAAVRRNEHREIGWFPVERTGPGADGDLGSVLPPRMEAFHWHGETFDLPRGSRLLARSEACENQAFALGDRVLAIQFHLETTPDSARALIRSCPGDLAPGRYVQDESEIMSAPRRFARINAVMSAALDRLAARMVSD